MNKEEYISQKIFAGEKKPSMQRRCVGHDYTGRQMYMITMTTQDRLPILGTLVGRSDAPDGTPDAPRVLLTELGQRVEACWNEIAVRYPQICLVALQMMPDHFHGILFVKERLSIPVGKVLLGFKQGCNKAYRQLFPTVQSVAVLQPSTPQPSTPQPQLTMMTARTAFSLPAVSMTGCCYATGSCSTGCNTCMIIPAACS